MPHSGNDFEAEHAAIFFECTRIFKSKSQIRGQMWLEWPPSDKIREMRERLMRIEKAYWSREQLILKAGRSADDALDRAIIEDGIDLINYTNFLIKQIHRGMSG